MRQAENIVDIDGTLYECEIKEGATSDGRKYAKAELSIKCNVPIGDEMRECEIPVTMFAMENKSDGTHNSIYDSILDLPNQYTSATKALTPAAASRVRISGRIEENMFPSRSGEIVSSNQITTNFINSSSTMGDAPDSANFMTEIVIGAIKDEVNKDNEETGRLIVKGIIVGFNDRINVINFIVESNEAINHIKTYWNEGDTVEVAGYCNFSAKVITSEKQVGFGEPVKRSRTIYTKEFVITSGSESGYDEESAYNTDEIKAALSDRTAKMEEMKNKKKSTATKNTNPVGFDF